MPVQDALTRCGLSGPIVCQPDVETVPDDADLLAEIAACKKQIACEEKNTQDIADHGIVIKGVTSGYLDRLQERLERLLAEKLAALNEHAAIRGIDRALASPI